MKKNRIKLTVCLLFIGSTLSLSSSFANDSATLPPPPPSDFIPPVVVGSGKALTGEAAKAADREKAAKDKADARRKKENETRVQRAIDLGGLSTGPTFEEHAAPAAPPAPAPNSKLNSEKRPKPPRGTGSEVSTEDSLAPNETLVTGTPEKNVNEARPLSGDEAHQKAIEDARAAVDTGTPSQTKIEVDATDLEPIARGQEAVKAVSKFGKDCCLSTVYQRNVDDSVDRARAMRATFESDVSHVEGTRIEAGKGDNGLSSRFAKCNSRTGDYNVCIYDGEVVPGQFNFRNTGPNKMVTPVVEGKMREWIFNYEGRNQQDLSFSVSDAVDGTAGHDRESHFMVFPRTYVPSIRIEGDKQIVTLPTGETVTYNAKTKEVLSGVLSEKPLGHGGGAVTYTGKGLQLRVDGNRDPRQNKGVSAVVSKDGKTCKIPLKSLWPDQSESSALHFKFKTDDAFDAFLKTRPGCPSLF